MILIKKIVKRADEAMNVDVNRECPKKQNFMSR